MASKALDIFIRGIRGLLLVIAGVEAVGVVVFAVQSLPAQAIIFAQGSLGAAAYALALGYALTDSGCHLGPRDAKHVRKILLCLLVLELALSAVACIAYGILTGTHPHFGISFTAGFPDPQMWGTLLGGDADTSTARPALLLDIPLLTMVMLFYAMENDESQPHGAA